MFVKGVPSCRPDSSVVANSLEREAPLPVSGNLSAPVDRFRGLDRFQFREAPLPVSGSTSPSFGKDLSLFREAPLPVSRSTSPSFGKPLSSRRPLPRGGVRAYQDRTCSGISVRPVRRGVAAHGIGGLNSAEVRVVSTGLAARWPALRACHCGVRLARPK